MNKLIFILLICFMPLQAWSAFDTDILKTDLQKQAMFKISQWKKAESENIWSATTALQHVSITIGQKKAKFIAPYINSGQKTAAKLQCAKFAAITSQSNDEDSYKRIKKIILAATTRHTIKYVKLNDVKFTVSPRLIGAVVSLHCSTKPI